MNCNFKTGIFSSSVCSSESFPLNILNTDDIDILLSEVGLLNGHVTQNYIICSQHRDSILERNRLNKLRLNKCAIPSHLCFHQNGNSRGERSLTKAGMLKIHRNTGLVLPIGIPICTRCRKHLTYTSSESGSELLNASNTETSACNEHDFKGSITHIQVPVEDDEGEVWSTSVDGQSNLEVNDVSLSEEEYCDSQPVSTYSQGSEALVCAIGKREHLNHFLQVYNLSPVKEKRLPLKLSGEKTTKKCVSKALECLSAICETICPGEGEALKDMVFTTISKNQFEQNVILDSSSALLKDIYNNAETWTLQRQILSIITKERNFSQTKQLLPDITPWRFYKAKNHSDDIGCGLPVQREKVVRDKVDASQLEHFIDFIVSSDIVKDLPYGMKTMRLSIGEIVEIPNLIRSLAPSSLIAQYTEYCDSENIKHLGTSTLYKILNDCAASVRKCVEGLDYYVAEGGRAFHNLEAIIDKVDLSEEDRKRLKSQFLDAKRYIKSDYKVHIQQQSSVADHCRHYALSAPESCFAMTCSHNHDELCSNCNMLEKTLQEISEHLSELVIENKDAVLFEAESAIESIKEWKCHILRSRNQEDARINLVKDLQSGQLLVTCDWAMKYLPRKYREGQTDWFAKRGINWHISVTIYKEGDCIRNFTHVHIFSSQVSQDAAVTTSLMVDLVEDLIKLMPRSKEIHFFSDNAGCYKNTFLLSSLHHQLGDKVKSYNFSEAQDGKEDQPPLKRQKTSSSTQFDCPKDGCVKSFDSQHHLDEHLLLGNCNYDQKLSLHDKAKVLYGNKVNTMFVSAQEVSIPCTTQTGSPNVDKGWALKSKKKRTLFTNEQKEFMQEMFTIGKRTGRKVDPYDAAQEMRSRKDGSTFAFTRDQYLTGQQISSYFSRLALKDRKTDIEDLRSAEDEDNKKNLKLLILKNLDA